MPPVIQRADGRGTSFVIYGTLLTNLTQFLTANDA